MKRFSCCQWLLILPVVCIVLFGIFDLVYQVMMWEKSYEHCVGSRWNEVHQDVIQPITRENVDHLHRFSTELTATLAFFDPSGEYLIVYSGLESGYHSGDLIAINLSPVCRSRPNVFSMPYQPQSWNMGIRVWGGCITGEHTGVSTDGMWLVVDECGSWHHPGTIQI